MPEILTRPVRPSRRADTRIYALVAAVFAVAMVPLMSLFEDGARADVVFVNDTPWDIGVALAVDGDNQLPLGTLAAERSRTIGEILEPGTTWDLRWKFAGREVHRSLIADHALREGRYVVTVPDEVATRLRLDGAPPSP